MYSPHWSYNIILECNNLCNYHLYLKIVPDSGTWKQVTTCEKPSRHTKGIGTRGCLSSSLHPPMTLWAWPQLTQRWGEKSTSPVTCYLVLPMTRIDPPSTTWQTSRTGYTASTITPTNIWSWPVAEQKCAITAWRTLHANKRVTKCGCIRQPTLKESHQSFIAHGRAHTQQSHKSIMWSTGFSNTLERRWQ